MPVLQLPILCHSLIHDDKQKLSWRLLKQKFRFFQSVFQQQGLTRNNIPLHSTVDLFHICRLISDQRHCHLLFIDLDWPSGKAYRRLQPNDHMLRLFFAFAKGPSLSLLDSSERRCVLAQNVARFETCPLTFKQLLFGIPIPSRIVMLVADSC